MLVLSNGSHQTQKMRLAASAAPGDELNLAAAVFDVFLKILFLPEIRQKINPAGEPAGRIQCGRRSVIIVIFIVEIRVHILTSYSSSSKKQMVARNCSFPF